MSGQSMGAAAWLMLIAPGLAVIDGRPFQALRRIGGLS